MRSAINVMRRSKSLKLRWTRYYGKLGRILSESLIFGHLYILLMIVAPKPSFGTLLRVGKISTISKFPSRPRSRVIGPSNRLLVYVLVIFRDDC